jgi:FKBP-type peptidyl-prolyl cis-trans isomerase
MTTDSAAFLERVRAQAGVEAFPSGLLVERLSRGADQSLPRPDAGASVLVHYEGKLADGSIFDSSFARNNPAEFPLNAVVKGFSEAIQQMRPGDEIVATFPHELGYGAAGRPPVIPQSAPLQFRIVLLSFFDKASGKRVGAG